MDSHMRTEAKNAIRIAFDNITEAAGAADPEERENLLGVAQFQLNHAARVLGLNIKD